MDVTLTSFGFQNRTSGLQRPQFLPLEAEAQHGHHGHVGRAGALLLEGFHCKSFWHALEALPVCMQWGPHLVEGNGRVSE